MEWMLLPLKRYADFDGRSRRMEFWMFRLFFYLVMTVLVVITFGALPWSEILSDNPPQDPDINPLFWVGLVLCAMWYLGCVVPSIAVCVRRFHDQDKSGWLWLLYFIPYIGWLIVVIFMFIEGTKGSNQYGEDPKDENTAGVFA